MSLEHLIQTFGYWAVLGGTLLEGETIVIIAGFLAHQGYLRWVGVVTAAFVGTLICDQFFFFWGRLQGQKVIERRPAWKQKLDRVERLTEKYRIWIVIGFRFAYGFRTILPFFIGMSSIRTFEFVMLNILGAALWSICFSAGGYFFGHALEILISDARKYERVVLLLLLGIGLAIWIGLYFHNRKRARHPLSAEVPSSSPR